MSSDIITGTSVTNLLHDKCFKVVWNTSYANGLLWYNVYRSNDPYSGFVKIIRVNPPDTEYHDCLPIDWVSNMRSPNGGLKVFYKVTQTTLDDGESDLNSSISAADTDVAKYMAAPYNLKINPSTNKEYYWLYNQAVNGAINGINTVFYTPYNYLPKSLTVYVAGKELNRDIDFTETQSNSFTLASAPLTGVMMSCSFVKY